MSKFDFGCHCFSEELQNGLVAWLVSGQIPSMCEELERETCLLVNYSTALKIRNT